MPKLKPGSRKPPAGFDTITGALDDFDMKMREAVNLPTDGLRKTETLWPILQITRERTRFLFDKARRGEITQDVVDFCVLNGFADKGLLEKWIIPGYESLCCNKCVASKDSNFRTTCICRVPRSQRDADVRCQCCGCTGCASCDGRKERKEQPAAAALEETPPTEE